MNVTEGETISMECVTGESAPPARVLWERNYTTFTQGLFLYIEQCVTGESTRPVGEELYYIYSGFVHVLTLTHVPFFCRPSVMWLWHFLYSVRQDPMSSLIVFLVLRALMMYVASRAGGYLLLLDTWSHFWLLGVHIWLLWYIVVCVAVTVHQSYVF